MIAIIVGLIIALIIIVVVVNAIQQHKEKVEAAKLKAEQAIQEHSDEMDLAQAQAELLQAIEQLKIISSFKNYYQDLDKMFLYDFSLY